MAPSSKKLKPCHKGAKASKKRKPSCINRRCYRNNLINAVKLVCTYYDSDYKPDKKVCMKCFIKSHKHYKHLEIKFKEGKCIMDSSFSNFDSHIVIGNLLAEKEKEEDKAESEVKEPNSSTSGMDVFPDQRVKNAIDSAINHYFNKNKHLIDQQICSCDKFINEGIIKCLVGAKKLDTFTSDLECEMASLRNELLSSYPPITPSLEPVDINDIEKKVKISQEEINKLIEKVKKNKGAKKLKLDKSDEDDIITIDKTVCIVPTNLPPEGLLKYPAIDNGQTVYGMGLTLNDPWSKGIIKNRVIEDYIYTVFQTKEKLMTTKQIAYSTVNLVRFTVGCRVIAKFMDPISKCSDGFYAGIVAEPPTMLNNFRYLIFFDNGHVQYQQHQNIRLIAHRTNMYVVWKDVQENSQDFIKSYLEKYPERLMVKLTDKDSVRAEYQCQWQMAKVLKVDASLVKLYFTDFNHREWIYRGSLRLYNIFEKQSKCEKDIQLRQSGLAYLNKPFVEFTSVAEEPTRLLSKNVARKSTSKNLTTSDGRTQKCNGNNAHATKIVNLKLPVPNFMELTKHGCNNLCVSWIAYNYESTRTMNMLTIPLYFGFVRYLTTFNKSQNCIFYKTPCGVTIHNITQMMEYLNVTKSAMTIDEFDFNTWVQPFAQYKVIQSVQFVKDISQGKEFKGIPCVNSIDSKLPPKMDYMTTRRPMPGVNINLESEFLCGCDCTDNCQDKSKCACWQMTIEGQNILPDIYKDPNIGYNYRRLPERVLTGIYECNKTCKCSSSCLNRVVQNPLSQKLQLFMTEKKGWGVQCLNDIPQGSFICVYVGHLLTEADANEDGKNYGDEYLAELDYIEVVEKVKENYESDVPFSDHEYETEMRQSESSNEYYPCRKSEMSIKLGKHKCKKSKTKKDGKHVQVLSKLNAHDMKDNSEPPKSVRQYFGKNESVYIMDSKTSGNIGRYLNHSCSPNIFVQNVFVDTHDLRFPWISFFALHYIKAGTELTWNYSYDVGSVPGKKLKCHCGALSCRKRLL